MTNYINYLINNNFIVITSCFKFILFNLLTGKNFSYFFHPYLIVQKINIFHFFPHIFCIIICQKHLALFFCQKKTRKGSSNLRKNINIYILPCIWKQVGPIGNQRHHFAWWPWSNSQPTFIPQASRGVALGWLILFPEDQGCTERRNSNFYTYNTYLCITRKGLRKMRN